MDFQYAIKKLLITIMHKIRNFKDGNFFQLKNILT